MYAVAVGLSTVVTNRQGDSSFHFYYLTRSQVWHVGSFAVEDVGDTAGIHYAQTSLGLRYPLGLLIVQNGEAPEPTDTGDINGCAFDGATQFKYVNFLETLAALFAVTPRLESAVCRHRAMSFFLGARPRRDVAAVSATGVLTYSGGP